MMNVKSAVVAALAVFSASGAMAATPVVSSSGSMIEGTFTINGSKSSLPNSAKLIASGKGPSSYNASKLVKNFSKSGAIGQVSISGTGKNLGVTAVSAGVAGNGSIEAHSSASADSFSAIVTGPAGQLLKADLTNLLTKVSYKVAKSGSINGTYTIGFGTLAVNAPAFGINNLKYTKATPPPKNFVFYTSADKTVKLVLNEETFSAAGISLSSVALHVRNFKYFGNTVSGDVTIATSIAK